MSLRTLFARSNVTPSRDAALRDAYLQATLAAIPRVLGAIDRNPYRATYGCMDREFWHYRTSAFPSEMHQEGVLPLAFVHATRLPGNAHFGNHRVAELAAAGIRFAARSSHADGSCDDYYPFERALGAAVFSLAACAAAYQLLRLDDAELLGWFRRRAEWIMAHGESGHLTNHHALAALGLLRVAQITGCERFRRAADAKIDQVLAWQDAEGWFEEYGGADPGYQTLTIDCLAKYRRATGDSRLDEPLRRAVDFARQFLHPDGSYGGIYGSRGTSHVYPHGFELLAGENAAAAELADGFLRRLTEGNEARLTDDRLYVHRVANLLEAYCDWSPTAPGPSSVGASRTCHFPRAGLLVYRTPDIYTVVSTARGGVFRHFTATSSAASDAGLIVETTDGRVAVSQRHDRSRTADYRATDEGHAATLTVTGPLCWVRFETMTPWKQIALFAAMGTVGRWCRTLVRRLLQRRLITGRKEAGIQLTRRFEWNWPEDTQSNLGCLGHNEAAAQKYRSPAGFARPTLCVIDAVELTDPRLRVKRMAFGTDHESAYVAATGGYDPGVLESWTDLTEYVEQLNRDRRVTITREW
jgi:hypothetical protein